ncbi:MAG: class I SAM-dependent methyltransferase [bacterium]
MSHERTVSELFHHLLMKHPELIKTLPLPFIPITEQTSIHFEGNFESHPIGQMVLKALFDSLGLNHHLPDWIVLLEGMSGKKYRYLINNLIRSMESPGYLEIGSWLGSTACAAIWTNKVRAVCVDNWSQFQGSKEKFQRNIKLAAGEHCDFTLIEDDFRRIDFSAMKLMDIYFFDGPHSEEDQYDGIRLALPALNKHFVLIVDDYNLPEVRKGSERAIQAFGLNVSCAIKIRTTHDDSHPVIQCQNSDWHNGYYIAVISKP